MTQEQEASIKSDAQAGSVFLALAVVASNHGIHEVDAEKRVILRTELRQHINCALAHFAAQFDKHSQV